MAAAPQKPIVPLTQDQQRYVREVVNQCIRKWSRRATAGFVILALGIAGGWKVNNDQDADARRFYRRAIAKDGGDWELWLDLALASTGDARRHALDRAATLNPLAKAIEQLLTG